MLSVCVCARTVSALTQGAGVLAPPLGVVGGARAAHTDPISVCVRAQISARTAHRTDAKSCLCAQ